jgi:hypothetical protein
MNSRIFSIIISIISVECTLAQHVGINIGNADPIHPLTVQAAANGIGIVQKNGTVEVGFKTNASGAWITTLSNHSLNLGGNLVAPALTISPAGNTGIGLGSATPEFKLDIGARMRIQHVTTGNQTAGFFLDGTSLPARSFFGMIDQYYTGISGGGGTNWNFAMHVGNGNTGIGTTTPTARLDVNGDIRIRGNSPVVGSMLISNDNNGNATWQDPVEFRTEGCLNGDALSVPGNTWTKVLFNSTMAYNLGLMYQPLASQFVAPVRGIYHFTTQVAFQNKRNEVGVGFGGSRNGTALSLPYIRYSNGGITDVSANTTYPISIANVVPLSADLRLEAGDIVWVIVYRSGSDTVNPAGGTTWFTGRLITPL